MTPIRLFLLTEAATFLIASLIHAGIGIQGYEHGGARVAETVIGLALLLGLVLTWMRPTSARSVGLAAQGFALLGTLVGILTIVLGVGPRTVPDVVYHVLIVAALTGGLFVAARAPSGKQL